MISNLACSADFRQALAQAAMPVLISMLGDPTQPELAETAARALSNLASDCDLTSSITGMSPLQWLSMRSHQCQCLPSLNAHCR